MGRPFISIVTISFNQSQYLRQCVDSVVSQKGDDVEYIVVDPGSTDDSRDILKSYGDAIDQLIFEPDRGPADGLNKGFARANGEVGYFINSDDFLLPGAISRMRRLWAENSQIDVLLGGAWMVDGDGKPLRELRATKATPSRLIDGGAVIVQQGMSFRLDTFRSMCRFNVENRSCWDGELLFDLLRLGGIAKLSSEKFGVFRVYPGTISSSSFEHNKSIRGDLDRMSRNLPPREMLLPVALARAGKFLRNPILISDRLRQRFFEHRQLVRWERDRDA